MPTQNQAQQEVRGVVARINRAWRAKDFDALPDCFAENAVMVGPDYVELGRGRAFFVESYREFSASATVIDYSESEALTEVFGDVAICAYRWTMTYGRDNQTQTESGTDQFVLSRIDMQWRVVWRYLFFRPQA
jgi:uncharacterized protein (TIGR02246 family)